MRRHTLMLIGLTLAVVGPVEAGTFSRAPIAPDQGVEVFNRDVARAQVGRDLFANPYATETISHVDVYDRFPYVESRQFEVVSDPRWNRLVFGERGGSLHAFDGRGTALGALAGPHGMAVDENDRLYVADTDNDRIVVLQASTEHGEMTLEPCFAIGGLAHPFDVAYSDGGTPFERGDDRLYVADAGRNRVVALAIDANEGRVQATLGDLGGGTGRFAGPLAIAVGRDGHADTHDVFVADAHNRRIVRLHDDGDALRWVSEAHDDAEVVTSLDTDQWGNVYAAAPQQGVVRKYSPDLAPVAELRDGLVRPRGFHVPFQTLHDHRDGTVARLGQPNGVTIDEWSSSGIRLWNLGLEVRDLKVTPGADASARFTLTDRASVAVDVTDLATGRTIAHRVVGALPAGAHTLGLGDDLRGTSDLDLGLRVTAASSYANGPSAVAQASFRDDGADVTLPSQPRLFANAPNPASPTTRFSFLLPAQPQGAVSLAVFDAQGRRVRTFDPRFAPGLNDVAWDGADDHGHPAQAGVYFYRLEVGDVRLSRRMVLVR